MEERNAAEMRGTSTAAAPPADEVVVRRLPAEGWAEVLTGWATLEAALEGDSIGTGLGRQRTSCWITIGRNGSNHLDLVDFQVNQMAHWTLF
jgi:hypothetical protein